MKIGVVIPTVTGREEYLSRSAHSHCPNDGVHWVDWHLAIYRDLPTCGHAWVRGVRDLLARGVDFICITCDDFEARREDYWYNAIAYCEAGELPAPILYNAGEDTRWQSSLEDGAPGELARCTRSPHMLSAEQAREIFSIRVELAPFQYYGDSLLGDIGARLGWPARICPGFEFTHHWAEAGRHTDEQNAIDHERYKAALLKLDHLLGPPKPPRTLRHTDGTPYMDVLDYYGSSTHD